MKHSIKKLVLASVLCLLMLPQVGCVVVGEAQVDKTPYNMNPRLLYLSSQVPDTVKVREWSSKNKKGVPIGTYPVEVQWGATVYANLIMPVYGVMSLGCTPFKAYKAALHNSAYRYSLWTMYGEPVEPRQSQHHPGSYSVPPPSFSGPSR